MRYLFILIGIAVVAYFLTLGIRAYIREQKTKNLITFKNDRD